MNNRPGGMAGGTHPLPILLPPPRWRRGGGFPELVCSGGLWGLQVYHQARACSDGALSPAFLVAGHGYRDVLLTNAFSYTLTVATAGVDTVFYVFKQWFMWRAASEGGDLRPSAAVQQGSGVRARPTHLAGRGLPAALATPLSRSSATVCS